MGWEWRLLIGMAKRLSQISVGYICMRLHIESLLGKSMGYEYGVKSVVRGVTLTRLPYDSGAIKMADS